MFRTIITLMFYLVPTFPICIADVCVGIFWAHTVFLHPSFSGKCSIVMVSVLPATNGDTKSAPHRNQTYIWRNTSGKREKRTMSERASWKAVMNVSDLWPVFAIREPWCQVLMLCWRSIKTALILGWNMRYVSTHIAMYTDLYNALT